MKLTLLEKYQQGAITANHLIVDTLNAINPQDPGQALEPLPSNILHRMESFIDKYNPDQMLTNYGTLPSANQLAAAQKWMTEFLRLEANKVG